MKSSRAKKRYVEPSAPRPTRKTESPDPDTTLLEDAAQPMTVEDLRHILQLSDPKNLVILPTETDGIFRPVRIVSGETMKLHSVDLYEWCSPHDKEAVKVSRLQY
jgi:hypothetical protein